MRTAKARGERKIAFVKAFLRVADAWAEVTIANVSSSGLMVRYIHPPQVGSEVELRRRGVVIRGEVVWSRSTRFGVRSLEKIDRSPLLAVSHVQVDRRGGGRAEAARRAERRWCTGADMDRRDRERAITYANVKARANGKTFSVELSDVSTTGCMVKCASVELAQGDSIVFTFVDMIRVTGKVAWLQTGAAGVHFDDCMHPAIAAHLEFKPATTVSHVQPRDRFGRALPLMIFRAGRNRGLA